VARVISLLNSGSRFPYHIFLSGPSSLGISTEAPVMTVELSKLRNTVGAALSFYR